VTYVALTELASALRADGAIDEAKCTIGASFTLAKCGGDQIGSTKRGKDV